MGQNACTGVEGFTGLGIVRIGVSDSDDDAGLHKRRHSADSVRQFRCQRDLADSAAACFEKRLCGCTIGVA